MGTAIGSAMASSYASLFMGKFEDDFLSQYSFKPDLWFHFLDDIFCIWSHSLEKLYTFIEDINSFHPTIKLTANVSKCTVSFLDVNVSLDDNNQIHTNIHVKETNNHQYLDYSSCHPVTCKNGIPYSQGKRYRRIISDDDKFNESLQSLRVYFRDRKYPDYVVDNALNKISCMTQDEALCSNNKASEGSVIPFVVKYNPSLPNISNIIRKYWDLLKLSSNCSVQNLHDYRPLVAFKRPKNLKDILINSNIRSFNDNVKC